MENQTRFDLNAALENWRQELAAQPALTSDDRRELETHLCDVLAELRARGLGDEEAFHLARRRLGHPQKLAEEFTQENPVQVWRERIYWMWLALFLSKTLGGLGYTFIAVVMQHHTFQDSPIYLRLVIPTLAVLCFLFPAVMVFSLAKGKFVLIFSKLLLLVENRRRLAMAIVACIVLSSACRLIVFEIIWSGIKREGHFSTGSYENLVVNIIIMPAIYLLVFGPMLIWLQPRKTFQSLRTA